MSVPEAYLFVYGTLRKGVNRMGDLIAGHIEWVGSGSIKGRLYDLGSYPGAVADDTADVMIKGEVMRVKDPAKVFTLLDRYEGFRPDDLSRSAFVRSTQLVYEDDGNTREAWVYWYNFPVVGKTEITGKDYLSYLKQKGKRT